MKSFSQHCKHWNLDMLSFSKLLWLCWTQTVFDFLGITIFCWVQIDHVQLAYNSFLATIFAKLLRKSSNFSCNTQFRVSERPIFLKWRDSPLFCLLSYFELDFLPPGEVCIKLESFFIHFSNFP